MDSLWKPFLRENILNPYPMYQRIRETEGIYSSNPGEWVITRYEDAKAILKDDQFKVGNRADWLSKVTERHQDQERFKPIVKALDSFIVFKNPPDHTLLRKLIMQAWNNHEVDQIIANNIDSLIENLNPGHFDMVTAFAVPLPAMTMTRILGLPMEDHRYLQTLAHQMMKSLDLYLTFREIEKMNEATKAFTSYFENQAKIKLSNPDNDLLSRLIQLNRDKAEVPHHELIANCYFLFIAGGETSAGLIGPGIYHLISKGKFEAALKDEQLCKTATDELLRFDAPTQLVGRIASEDIEVGNHLFRKGDLLTVCLGAANRDPEKFEKPDDLIIDRTPNHHLTFSTGIHRCLGDWLAKREFELLLHRLADQFESMKIQEEPEWKENLGMRSFSRLMVSCQ